jgi:hypothetical protein
MKIFILIYYITNLSFHIKLLNLQLTMDIKSFFKKIHLIVLIFCMQFKIFLERNTNYNFYYRRNT